MFLPKGMTPKLNTQSRLLPTGFAFAADDEEAEFLAREARAVCPPGVEIKVCKALNRGAEVVAGPRSAG